MTEQTRLLLVLKDLGISAKELSQIAEIEESVCYKFYKGKSMFGYRNLAKIKKAFPMIDLNYIITGV